MTQDKALQILKSGKNVFLTGEPGSGKSYTVNMFKQWMREEGIPYAITASTGIAATHIGGITIHSWSGIGIKEEVTDLFIQNILLNKPFVAKKINHPRVLIIDEISMLGADTLDNIERIISGVRGTTIYGEAWGGLQVIFVGDFFQLPPVAKYGKEVPFAFEAKSWAKANLNVCYLTEQHRQSDPLFLEILTAIRNESVTDEHKKALRGSWKGTDKPGTQLFTHNMDVDRINDVHMREIKGEPELYVMTSEGNDFLVDMFKRSCLSPEKLYLKVGARVMFTRNKYDQDTGRVEYVNGTLGIITGFLNKLPVVTTLDGNEIVASHEEWSIEENGVVRARVMQIPLKLAWAVTVHKSQGMSLDEARIDLGKAFEYGQGYVAISRVKSLDGLMLERINATAFEMHPKVVAIDEEFREESKALEAIYF